MLGPAPVDRDVINLDAAFGQALLNVSIGEAVAQIPADVQQDHLRWEPEPNEGSGLCWVAMIPPRTLTARCPAVNATVPPKAPSTKSSPNEWSRNNK